MEKGIFLRKTSGVIRTMSHWDAMFYGYLVITGLYVLTFYFLSGSGMFPGANVYVACLILLAVFFIRWIPYAGLISSMPRSGGDYVYQSRLLNGLVGFVFTNAGMVWWQVFWDYLAGNTIAIAVLPQIFNFIGVATNNQGLVNLGLTLADPWVACVISIILLWVCLFIMLRGLRPYVILQYFLMIFTFICLIAMVVLYVSTPTSTFITNFNNYQNIFSFNENWYQTVITTAQGYGFNPNPGFSWVDTLGLVALYYGLWTAVSFAMELVGEVKGVESYKTAYIVQFGAILLMAITTIIGIAWARDYMGVEFTNSIGYLATFYPGAIPGFEFRGVYQLFACISLNIPISILIALGIIAGAVNSLFNGFLGASRLLLAQSFDRLWPEWMGHVNKRGAPDYALILLTCLSTGIAVLLTGFPSLLGMLQTALMCQFIGFAVSLIGAMVFPWVAPKIYEASPISKYKIGRVPIITITAVVSVAFDIWVIWLYFTNPNYGIWPASTLALIFTVAMYVLPTLWYFIMKYYRRRQGIDIELAFKEVPPA